MPTCTAGSNGGNFDGCTGFGRNPDVLLKEFPTHETEISLADHHLDHGAPLKPESYSHLSSFTVENRFVLEFAGQPIFIYWTECKWLKIIQS